jgi:hypothetical protein
MRARRIGNLGLRGRSSQIEFRGVDPIDYAVLVDRKFLQSDVWEMRVTDVGQVMAVMNVEKYRMCSTVRRRASPVLNLLAALPPLEFRVLRL